MSREAKGRDIQMGLFSMPADHFYEYLKVAAEVVLLLDISTEHVVRAERSLLLDRGRKMYVRKPKLL